jgi:membrane-associated phospholipid phosphatase
MNNILRARVAGLILTALCCAPLASPARAQSAEPASAAPEREAPAPAASPERPPLFKPFTQILGDLKRLPTAQNNVDWLVGGLGAAMAVHYADRQVTQKFSLAVREPFEPGAFVGATPIELGAAFATYAVGRATDSPRAISLGSDLIRAQLLAEVVTIGVKQAVRRTRPDGSGFSFPSGHTAVTFASATVLQRHFGWKVGVPAYGVAAYVATSRVQMKRHYLSDVAFGAAVGIVAGRTVTIGRNTQLMVAPIAAAGGGGIGFTLTRK